MLLEMLRAVIVGLLLIVVPGYLLVQALLPPGAAELTRLERAYLAVAGGVVLVTLVGLVLGFWPHGERGYMQTSATGKPYAEMWLLVVSSVLFAVGVLRGAYPQLARLVPRRAGGA